MYKSMTRETYSRRLTKARKWTLAAFCMCGFVTLMLIMSIGEYNNEVETAKMYENECRRLNQLSGNLKDSLDNINMQIAERGITL